MPLTQDRNADYMLNYSGPRMPVYSRDGRQIGWSGTMPNGRSFFMNDSEQRRLQQMQRDRAAFRRMYNVARIAGIGIPAAAAVVPAVSSMFGSAAPAAASAGGAGAASAAPAAAAAGYSSPGIFGGVSFGAPVAAGAGTGAAGGGAATIVPAAATAGRAATIGRMFSSPGMALAVNAGLSIYGQRSQNRAADQARADLLEQNRQALALQIRQLELEAQNAQLDREERQALNAELNRLRRMELEAAEEERAWRRSLEERREARLEPYRRVSEAAMNRISSMWGLS